MKIRLGLVTSEFPPDLGGVETYAWELAKELGKCSELQVTVYAPRGSRDVEPPPQVTIRPVLTSCREADWFVLRHEPMDVWHALSAAHGWLALEHKPAVISVHGNDFLAPYPLTMRPALSGPLVWRWRNLAWKYLSPLWRVATRRMLSCALPKAHSILANSRYTGDVLASIHPNCAELVRVAAVGVGERFFSIERNDGKNRPSTFLTVCRLAEPRKNVELVLAALAGLKDEFDFRYVIAGDGYLRPGLEVLAQRLGIADRVHFAGRVSDAELERLYSEADLFVLTSSIIPGSHEGFGIVYLEAAACGLPSLAARLAGACEAVQEHVSGYFVQDLSEAAIRTALKEFLAGQRSFDSRACRAFARQFSWAKVASCAIESYRSAIARHIGYAPDAAH